MICIFKGKPSLGLNAGEVRLAIRSQVSALEESNLRQERQDGCFTLTLDTNKNVIREIPDRTARRVHCSPSLGGLTMADFPPGFAFGNGVTTGALVRLSTGPQILSWCVFPDSQADLIDNNFEKLQNLFES